MIIQNLLVNLLIIILKLKIFISSWKEAVHKNRNKWREKRSVGNLNSLMMSVPMTVFRCSLCIRFKSCYLFHNLVPVGGLTKCFDSKKYSCCMARFLSLPQITNLRAENEHDDPACFTSTKTKYITVIIAGLTRKKAGRPPIPLRNTGNSKIQDLLSGLISTGKVLKICGFQYLEYPITAYHDKYKILNLA